MKFMLCFIIAKFSLFNYPSNYKPKEDAIIEQRLKQEVIKIAEANYSIVCISQGGGGFENRRLYALGFNHNGRLTINQSRELIVNLVKICIDRFDSNQELKPYLEKKKIDSTNFDICLFFREKDGGFINKKEFSICGCYKGHITYDNMTNIFDSTILEETYAEAMEKIAFQKG